MRNNTLLLWKNFKKDRFARTEGAASGEPSLLELSRVASEEDR